MVIIFIVVANEVLKCYGMRYCEPGSAIELMRLWQIGFVEIMAEATLGNVLVRVWRRKSDKIVPDLNNDRGDAIINPRDLGK